jgi:hypothetical protein
MVFEQDEEPVEIGKIKRDNASDIIIRVTKFKGVTYVDIRHWLKLDTFTGFGKKGISLPVENLDELIEILKKVKK